MSVGHKNGSMSGVKDINAIKPPMQQDTEVTALYKTYKKHDLNFFSEHFFLSDLVRWVHFSSDCMTIRDVNTTESPPTTDASKAFCDG